MTKWTREKLSCLSGDDLWYVFENAQKKDTPDYREVRNLAEEILIERENLSVGESGIKSDSPFGKLMNHYISSDISKAAALAATKQGLPALIDVEPILVKKLGVAYSKKYEATVLAGRLLRRIMDQMGYIPTQKKRKMPDGSIAKTSEFYQLKQ